MISFIWNVQEKEIYRDGNEISNFLGQEMGARTNRKQEWKSLRGNGNILIQTRPQHHLAREHSQYSCLTRGDCEAQLVTPPALREHTTWPEGPAST